jgi:nucleoside-diphosphate-sugar epimerase
LKASSLKKKVIKYGNGTAVRDWLYVEDAAVGVLAALKDSDEFSIFNFGTGLGTTLNELIQLVIDVTGEKPKIVFEDIPPGDAVLAGTCDFQKANDVLGWKPTTDLKTGLRLMYEYMKNNQLQSSK